MAKYSYELKKEIVTAYLNGEGGYAHLAPKYGIADKRTVTLWVNNYQSFGDDALGRAFPLFFPTKAFPSFYTGFSHRIGSFLKVNF